MDKEEVITLLGKLSQKGRLARRHTALLRDPVVGADSDWYMWVPTCYNDALDIKWNCGEPNPGWTQAGIFSFKVGDVMYDTPDSQLRWGDALKSINLGVRVKSASAAAMSGRDRNGKPIRFSGSVAFDVLLPTPDRSKLVETFSQIMTQDEFVRFLIDGPSGELAAKLESHQERQFK